jgi:hypothetical protein
MLDRFTQEHAAVAGALRRYMTRQEAARPEVLLPADIGMGAIPAPATMAMRTQALT